MSVVVSKIFNKTNILFYSINTNVNVACFTASQWRTRDNLGLCGLYVIAKYHKVLQLLCTAGDKVALIIGISTYRSFGQPLPAVEHDLYSTIKVFTEMKFKVISLLDLTLTEMVNAVDEFCSMLTPEVYGKMTFQKLLEQCRSCVCLWGFVLWESSFLPVNSALVLRINFLNLLRVSYFVNL